jgi:ABC-2 type transport system ATP-binding protein
VIADDTLHGLYRLLPAKNVLVVELEDGGPQTQDFRALPVVESAVFAGSRLRIGIRDLAADTPTVLRWLVDHGHKYRHVVSERADLETVFLTLTGRSLRD